MKTKITLQNVIAIIIPVELDNWRKLRLEKLLRGYEATAEQHPEYKAAVARLDVIDAEHGILAAKARGGMRYLDLTRTLLSPVQQERDTLIKCVGEDKLDYLASSDNYVDAKATRRKVDAIKARLSLRMNLFPRTLTA